MSTIKWYLKVYFIFKEQIEAFWYRNIIDLGPERPEYEFQFLICENWERLKLFLSLKVVTIRENLYKMPHTVSTIKSRYWKQ